MCPGDSPVLPHTEGRRHSHSDARRLPCYCYPAVSRAYCYPTTRHAYAQPRIPR